MDDEVSGQDSVSRSTADTVLSDTKSIQSGCGSLSAQEKLRVLPRFAQAVRAFQTQKPNKPVKEDDNEDNIMNQTAETQQHIEKAKKTSGILADDSWVPIWELILLLVTLYFEISVSLNDIYDNWSPTINLPFDCLGSLLFMIDIAIRAKMQTSVVVSAGLEAKSTSNTIVNYVKTWFCMDFLAAAPIHIVCYLAGFNDAHKVVYHLTVLKAVRAYSYFEQVNPEAISARYIYVYYQVVPLVQLLFWTIFSLHLLVIVRLALIEDRKYESQSYTIAAYYVLYTVTTVGYGDVEVKTTQERVFACFLFIFGTFANAAIIGKLSKIMQSHNIKSERKARMMETLAVMKYFNIPKSLQQEVLAFQNHILQHNVGSSYSKIIDGLPVSMQQHIGLYVRIKFIGTVEMFKSANKECKVALAEGLKNVVFAPGQYIITAGDVGSEMFFMGHGYADVLSADGMYLATIKKGGFFGEVALLVETLRTASIRALTYCDLFRLDKADFHTILDSFPEFNEQIQSEIRARKEAQGTTPAKPDDSDSNNSKHHQESNNSTSSSSSSSNAPSFIGSHSRQSSMAQSYGYSSEVLRSLARRKSSAATNPYISSLIAPGTVPLANFTEDDETIDVCKSMLRSDSIGIKDRARMMSLPSSRYLTPEESDIQTSLKNKLLFQQQSERKPTMEPGPNNQQLQELHSTLQEIHQLVTSMEGKIQNDTVVETATIHEDKGSTASGAKKVKLLPPED